MKPILYVCASTDRRHPWQVRRKGSRSALKLFRTKAAAVRSAFQRAHRSVAIFARDGRLQVHAT